MIAILILKTEILNEEFTIENLHNVAIKNLEAYLKGKIRFLNYLDHVVFVQADDNFESTIVLLDFYMNEIAKRFNDNLIISIPNESFLFVCSENSSIGQEMIRKNAREIYNTRERGRLTNELYRKTKDGIEYYDVLN